jgi:gliding motility-associated-like protein
MLCLRATATHIVGGEMIYDFLGKNADGSDRYRITLRIYRDCGLGEADFDGFQGTNAYLSVLAADQSLTQRVNIGMPVVTRVPPSINSPCMQAPTDICVEEGVYTYTLDLQPRPGGYYIVYQRCCRNVSILNLIQQQGATYYAHIPGPEDATGNSSPRFNKFPPIFLCGDINFYFDHAATDPDGDELVYTLYTPFAGLDACCPILGAGVNTNACGSPPLVCPTLASPPPFAPVIYTGNYSAMNPLASNPALAIDPATGKLIGKPNLVGQFVVCIAVKEYRNGKLLNIHYRDFQFNIKSCVVSVISDMADQVKKCIGNVITFTNQSVTTVGGLTFKWDFGVPNKNDDTSNVTHPTYTYADTGMYVVTLIGNPYKSCSDTVRKKFHVYPTLAVNFPPADKQCFKNNAFSFSVAGSHMSSATFTWNFSPSATPSVSSDKTPANVRFKEPGVFFVRLYGKQLTCIDSFIDSVRIVRRPEAKIITGPQSRCVPATVTFSNGTISDEPARYQWNFGDGKKTSARDPVTVFTEPGIYWATLMAITDGVCKDTSVASISQVTVHALPVPGFSVSPEVTSIFDPLISIKPGAGGEGLSYLYDFGDGTISYHHNPDHVYADYGNYTITQYVTDIHGCTDSIKDIIIILPEHRFWAPDAFTPDANGLNDEFMPCAIGVTAYDFQVYDRWGRLVFRTSDPQMGWDGSYRGEECPQGVYAWKVSYRDILNYENALRCGHVTLIRNP